MSEPRLISLSQKRHHADGATGLRAAALARLPQPLHLFAHVTGSRHYHLGCFNGDETALPVALDGLSLRCARYLRGESRVLDLGCGLGGTADLLAEMGHEVVGIDPCGSCIQVARSAQGSLLSRFVRTDFERFVARHRGARFDAIVMIETLQHFPSLEDLLDRCRSILEPGGLLVVQDIEKVPDVPFERVPWHRRGELRRAAGGHGFSVQDRSDLTRYTAPSLRHMTEEVLRQHTEIVDVFRSFRPDIQAEIDELLTHMSHLRRAFEAGDLVFEELVLRLDSRNGRTSIGSSGMDARRS